MGSQLTKQTIKTLCDRLSYERGEEYFRAGKVTFTNVAPGLGIYEASVKGNGVYDVRIEFDSNGNVEAECSCPSLASYNKYCSHIAAALLHIQSIEPDIGRKSVSGAAETDNDAALVSAMLGLFGDKTLRPPSGTRALFDTREPLDVEFTCKPVAYGYCKFMLGIELKVGPKRLFAVQKLRDFLERVDRGETYVFSKSFAYDPMRHSFQSDNDAVLRQLISIYRNEKLYRDTSDAATAQAFGISGERMLLVPPSAWSALHPRLAAAPAVKLEQDDRTYDGFRLSDEPLPIRFAFDREKDDAYLLDVQGLDGITVMDAYGVVLFEGNLLKLKPESCQRLSELKQTLDSTRKHRIRISRNQIEPFMEKVIPGLKKLGSVHIAQSVSDRIVHTPLQARLYLDRVRDRLVAGLEFQYGDLIVNPLEENDRRRGTDHIVMRDGEREGQILELMEQSSFAKTEAGYFMEDEEAEYEFLYRVVPELEKLLRVYATSAVKTRLHIGNSPPKVTVDADERTDWLDVRFDIEGIPESEIKNVLQSLEEKRNYHRLPNGALLPLETAEFQEMIAFMNEVGIRQLDAIGNAFRLPALRGLRLLDSKLEGHAVKFGKSFRRLLENMRNPDNFDFSVPIRLVSVLRDYQKFGFQWMKTLAHYRFGGILADDMGLGKTLQSIAFLVSVLPEIRKEKVPALIVAPASLVYNWRNELKKFAPEIRAVIADGTKEARNKALNHSSRTDVIITSYPLLRRDIEWYATRPFHTLILDEAQTFKNYATQTAQAVKTVEARYRFALSGTPIENRLEELWSIFDAVFPELFPGRREFGELSREAVSRRARPFLLRRLKTDVLKELPEKIETLQASELLPDQKKLYAAYLAKLRKEALKHLDTESFGKVRIKMLAGITRLRQLCCHPALFVEDYEGGSAKFEQLLELVEECRSAGRRALVFSQFTEMLDLIGRELVSRGVPYFYLDGHTPAAERVNLCDRFNDGERELFLLSLKAGGTGLNLTGADTVILYDLWWNPAVEQQAADRAHRIGQRKVVQVIRLVAQGTVEDKMYELQTRKKKLIDEVIRPGQEELSSLTEQEILEILKIE
ncbi:SNF2 helicase associated domain-containing protein [Cohnella faecalis]|uniref:Helicase SNF n=1 Tax=Cohnella faecalis TaxID=2315694 RepID=A0A398CP65_9BACL|nr:DEAD/DEAH box helicase [Cohnella faecalis]RIE05186.1 helicase SNF [Cohnella faecalis]